MRDFLNLVRQRLASALDVEAQVQESLASSGDRSYHAPMPKRSEQDSAASGDLSPGEHLRAEIERLGLDQVAVSKAAGVPRQSINNIVNGRQPISRPMAGKLGRLTGRGSDYWLRQSFPRDNRASASPRLAHDSGRARLFSGCLLVNHQIARAVKDGIVSIEPFKIVNVRKASIHLTVGDIAVGGEKVGLGAGKDFLLKPGCSVSVTTKERIGFPVDYVGRVATIKRLAAPGIMTSLGLQIEPGHDGYLQFWIFNAGASVFRLRAGDTVASLEIMPLASSPATDAQL